MRRRSAGAACALFSAALLLTTTIASSASLDDPDSGVTRPPQTGDTTPAVTSAMAIEAAEDEGAASRALAWLLKKRAADWGWGDSTAEALLAVRLAADPPPASPALDTQLSAKQLEVELLTTLWRHIGGTENAGSLSDDTEQNTARLSRYSLALSALCKDPRLFHAHDLIGALQHHEPRRDADHALAALAACAAGARARKRRVHRLLEIGDAPADHNVDTVALVVLALKCIVQDHRHRNLQHFLRRPVSALARQQRLDGSFGDVKTTALALQALHNEHEAVFSSQNRTSAASWLRAQQRDDGGWGDDVRTTSVALLALSKQGGLATARDFGCSRGESDIFHSVPGPFVNHVETPTKASHAGTVGWNESDGSPRNVSVSYTLWVGTNVSEAHTLMLTAPRNTTFFSVMRLAAERDARFAFEASEWPNGHYVHTLAGYREEPMGYHYWLLYRLPAPPDPTNPPASQLVAPGGVDDLLVDDGEYYLFWYKKL